MEQSLASFCLLTYNQENYIEEALKSALNQTYEPLEIIISDDGSTDKTFDLIQNIVKEYKGPHRIILNQNVPNLGIRENVNKVLYELSHGEYIIMAAGDDISDRNRTKIYVDYFQRFKDVMSISCLSMEVDNQMNILNPDGNWNNKFSIMNLEDYIFHTYFNMYSGDSRGLRRTVVSSFEKLKETRDEDIFLYFRSLLLGSALYLYSPLVKRRVHGTNTSKNNSDENMLKAMEKQLYEDARYAFDNRIITKLEYSKVLRKIEYIMDHFRIYSTSPISSPKVFFYRVLRKVFRLTKYRPMIHANDTGRKHNASY